MIKLESAHIEELSRRDILRFILVEPSKRSEEIQSLLKLDGIGQIRSALNTAQRKLLTAYQNASAQVSTSRETLRLHLQTMTISAESRAAPDAVDGDSPLSKGVIRLLREADPGPY